MLTIRIAEVRWPSEGKKTGLVTDHTGKQWGAFPEVLGTIEVGQTYDITYTSRPWNGKTYYTISKAFPSQGDKAPQRQAVASGAVGASPPQRPLTSQSDNERRLDIFVCGAFNNLMANPNVRPQEMSMMDMIDVLHKFKGAWNGVFGPSPLPRPAPAPRPAPVQQVQQPVHRAEAHDADPYSPKADDMNDEIPF